MTNEFLKVSHQKLWRIILLLSQFVMESVTNFRQNFGTNLIYQIFGIVMWYLFRQNFRQKVFDGLNFRQDRINVLSVHQHGPSVVILTDCQFVKIFPSVFLADRSNCLFQPVVFWWM